MPKKEAKISHIFCRQKLRKKAENQAKTGKKYLVIQTFSSPRKEAKNYKTKGVIGPHDEHESGKAG